MWMVGYNDGAELNMPDSFNGRKLRPLIPRSLHSASNYSRTHTLGANFFSLNHHLPTMGDQSKRDFNVQPVVVSSRWNPTPEQLRTLEELYRHGTRTPSTDQIQHITSQLRRYGKIEGKNVFYWFQNHKARERQKRRLQKDSATDEHGHNIDIFERKDLEADQTGYEVDQGKNWTTSMNCSTIAKESVLMPRAVKAALTECRSDGWIQLDEAELHYRRNIMERNGFTNLINTASTTTATTTATFSTPAAITATAMAPLATAISSIRTHDLLNIFLASEREHNNGLISHLSYLRNDEEGCGESQTLKLFPLCSEDGCDNTTKKETEISVAAMNDNLTPYQFFEFLPLKN
ncbi:hypothetical protein SLE2022_346450 [Rubroshorea leprosula]